MKAENKILLKALLWALSVGIVLITGIVYFPLEVKGLSFWGAFYYSIRLFILEHDISHFPTRTPLIFIYFFAPVVALSALGTALSYIYRFSPSVFSRLRKGHVIICGVGRTGKLLYAILREQSIAVVGVDRGNPDLFEDFISRHKASMVFGDFLSHGTLVRAGVGKASNVVFASSDDLLNLEGAVGLYNKLSQNGFDRPLAIWIHIANDRLSATTQAALKTTGPIKIRFFDTFNIAATKTVNNYFGIHKRKGIDKITILGFGEFGHDLMKALIRDAREGESWEIDVVDIKDRRREVFNLAEELNIKCRTTFTQSDILDVDLEQSKTRAVFLCTDDDIKNLSTALLLTQNNKGAYFYIRMAMWPLSAVKEHLGDGDRIQFVNINDLVREGIQDIRYMLA
jgi:voltage-gated potassium channel Kch